MNYGERYVIDNGIRAAMDRYNYFIRRGMEEAAKGNRNGVRNLAEERDNIGEAIAKHLDNTPEDERKILTASIGW